MTFSFVLFLLSVNLVPFGCVQGQKTAALQIRDVLPTDMMDMYEDYELLHIEESSEEDTVYISRRAPASGCSDCGSFTPWHDENSIGLAKRSLSLSSNSSTTRHLVARSEKKTPPLGICKDFAKVKNIIPRLDFESYTYPSNEALAKKSGQIWDFSPYDDPTNSNYFSLRSISTFQSRPDILNAKTGKYSKNRGVSVEHVLEWQVLLDFIRENEGRCAHFTKWFLQEVDIDTKLNVKDDQGTVTAKTVQGKGPRAIDWIAHQYPGSVKDRATKPEEAFADFFNDEFVSLHDSVNGRKKNLWEEIAILNKKEAEKWPNNHHWDPDSKKRTKWTPSDKNQGYCESVVALRDLVGVQKYHASPEIAKILKAQIDRITEAFKYLEEGPLKDIEIEDPDSEDDTPPMITYAQMTEGTLEAQWLEFIKKKHTKVISDLDSIMTQLAEKLKKATPSNAAGQSTSNQPPTKKPKTGTGGKGSVKRGSGEVNSPLCGQEPDGAAMKERIKAVLAEYEKWKGKWSNPYAVKGQS